MINSNGMVNIDLRKYLIWTEALNINKIENKIVVLFTPVLYYCSTFRTEFIYVVVDNSNELFCSMKFIFAR